ncbi:SDR family oxidoreductase [Phreatobacter aquaticus]|uniref:SDR family oxidoreductase n=1 Tax=Phreatobacter aquaticus TaxID=2570229 RepID=A0A4D7QJ07_9HYPH|nr:type I polyketide synthase [Phreatobacter aquaticus]QCK84372.1 SDR family oxidoreductase [Phreatobacter aquaticus]
MTTSGTDPIEAVAVIGMAGRFPGAGDVESFWRNLQAGHEAVSRFTIAELEAAGVPRAMAERPDYVPARGVLDGADCFDHEAFGYSPREAMLMDPQHRLMLETSHAALESAGYGNGQGEGWTGVFVGAARASYWLGNLADNPAAADGDDQIFIGNEKDFLATRVAFKLDLHGPAVDVQTGCSTSLVAIHLACRSLLSFECDMALAGGVTVALPLAGGYLHQEGSVLASDGHCRPFDAAGDGIVPGNAAAVVVLKRLSEALADGDKVHAVIRGSAINNDGARKMSFTAPSVEGQAQAILLAQQVAGVTADQIGLIEAHGTGTRLGDPIEVSALTQAFRETTGRMGFCALGSLKGNVGHLDAAAGVAGLIKAVCAVRDAVVPPTINVTAPNPAIDFAATPFYLATTATPWDEPVRRAGISAFGIGGTNAHVIVESLDQPRPEASDDRWRLMPISARSEAARDRLCSATATALAAGGLSLADAAFTLQTGRRHREHRAIVVARTAEEAASALRSEPAQGRFMAGGAPASRPKVAFLFPGGGVNYPRMALGLIDREPAFKEALTAMASHLAAEGVDIWPEIRGEAMAPSGVATALPAIFAISYALARLWQARGVMPNMMLGHSLGEYAAATVAGIFTPAEAARLVARRSSLQERSAGGAMLSVMTSAEITLALADPSIDIAAINGPGLCTASGPETAIQALEEALDRAGHRSMRLAIAIGAHARGVDQILGEFRAAFDGMSPRKPTLPVLSSLTGDWLEATDADYWAAHLRHTVRFDLALARLLEEPDLVLIECGPGDVCGALAEQHPAYRPGHSRVASLRKEQIAADDHAVLLTAIGQAWLAGVPVEMSATPGIPDGVRQPLPTYPFERNRLWIDPPAADRRRAVAPADKPIDDWFHIPSWTRALPPAPRSEPGSGAALVFTDEGPLGDAVMSALTAAGYGPVVTLRAGDELALDSEISFQMRPGSADDLAMVLTASGVTPALAVHLWSAGDEASDEVARGFHTLVALVQACAAARIDLPARVVVGTRHAQLAAATDAVFAARATLLGAAQVMPQEVPGLSVSVIDMGCEITPETAAQSLVREALAADPQPVVALRGRQRMLRAFEPVRLASGAPARRTIQPGDVIVITGGLGRVGLLLARHLTARYSAKVALIARPGFPEEADWSLVDAGIDPRTASRIAALRSLRASGADVTLFGADVADPSVMAEAFAAIERQLGPVRGIIHAAAVTRGSALISPILQLSPDLAAEQLAPKLGGLAGLDAAIAACRAPPAFVVMLSSNASILGGLGFAAYSAANHVLDLAAADRSRTGATDWISTNWDRWLLDDDDLAAGAGTSMDSFAMRPAESLDAFMRIVLAGEAEQFVVTRGDLEARRRIWIDGEAEAPKAAGSERPRSSRTAYRAPTGEAEAALCGLWGTLLGIDGIGIDDNFFELGGHSLRVIQLLARVSDMFGVRLPLKSFFAAPTIAGLAELILQALEAGGDRQPDSLLDGLGTLGGETSQVAAQ